MEVLTVRTDEQGRLALPGDFASCEVTIEVHGEELRIRKVPRPRPARKFTFRQLMAGVTKGNIHEEARTGPPVGREAL